MISGPVFGQNSAKPRPPRSLKYIFENFRDIEESHREEEWDEAEEALEELEESLGKLATNIENAGGSEEYRELTGHIDAYRSTLINHTSIEGEEMEEIFMEMQLHFLKITDLFNYRLSPVFEYFGEQLDEFKEEVLVEGEWDESESELEEIEEFWEVITEQYLKDNATALNKARNITEYIEELEDEVESENARRITEILRDIQNQLDSIVDSL